GFARLKTGKFGRRASCKECLNEYMRKYREENPEYMRKYYEENREAIRERMRKHYEENREAKREDKRKQRAENREARLEYSRKWREENREAKLEYSRKWREENREAKLEYDRKYYEENREARLEYSRKYYEENPDVYREAKRRRRARKRENGVEFYRDADIYDRDNWICQLCGKPIDPNAEHRNEDGSLNLWYKNIDHIIPLSKGGSDAPHNVQASHFRCNVSKGDRIDNDND